MGNFDSFEKKMSAAGMGNAAIRAFRRNYESLLRNESGMIPEDSIEPVHNLASLESLSSTAATAELISQAVVIKLNGDLGTGMGLQGPKSLLAVRDGVNFLDLMVRQIVDLRKTSGHFPSFEPAQGGRQFLSSRREPWGEGRTKPLSFWSPPQLRRGKEGKESRG